MTCFVAANIIIIINHTIQNLLYQLSYVGSDVGFLSTATVCCNRKDNRIISSCGTFARR